jgi:acyl-coenzyme A synthetase/AMP-(fatty) acid ligase/acyl carrier protein
MLRLFLDIDFSSECKSLQRVFCSGETLTWELQQAFLKRFNCELHNLYGPTEAAVDVSHWQCNQQESFNKVPIGYPIANTQLYVLDEQLQPVPQGVVGELYIGGIQVARGYLQREELNQASFIADPFNINSNGHIYKTGDLARYLPGGALEYIGRVDFQVKLNGNRIELTEIEAALCRHELINEAIVILHEEKEDHKQLVAYLLCSAKSLEELNLRQHLEKSLPYYMIPNHFVLLKEFPLTASGKVDRNSLPPPQDKKPAMPINAMQSDVNHIKLVSSIWQKILDMDEIDVQRNFFDNGGNSLLATELAFDLGNAFNIKIPLVKIFQYPTIISLARYLKDECSRSWDRKMHNGQAGKKIHLDN